MSIIKRFGICAHHLKRTHCRYRRKQRAIKVIDASRNSLCSHSGLDQCSLICVHFTYSNDKIISVRRVGCFNAQSA